jgi:hypothetical protein
MIKFTIFYQFKILGSMSGDLNMIYMRADD